MVRCGILRTEIPLMASSKTWLEAIGRRQEFSREQGSRSEFEYTKEAYVVFDVLPLLTANRAKA
jgi:hypothetical protein